MKLTSPFRVVETARNKELRVYLDHVIQAIADGDAGCPLA
jgi:hypothetical protein